MNPTTLHSALPAFRSEALPAVGNPWERAPLDPLTQGGRRSEESARAYRVSLRQILGDLMPMGEGGSGPVEPWETDELAGVLRLIELAGCDARRLEDAVAAWRDEAVRTESRATATIGRCLAALKAAFGVLAREGALPEGFDHRAFEVKAPKVVASSRRAGPGADVVGRIIKSTRAAEGPSASRDALAIALMGVAGLRRSEIVAARVGDMRQGASGLELWTRSKGSGGAREPIALASKPFAALVQAWGADYVEATRIHTGKEALHPEAPLIPTLDRWGNLGTVAMQGTGLLKMLRKRAIEAGLTKEEAEAVRPHGLRHQAITTASHTDEGKGNTPAMLALSRHAKVETLMGYVDDTKDKARSLQDAIARAYGIEE